MGETQGGGICCTTRDQYYSNYCKYRKHDAILAVKRASRGAGWIFDFKLFSTGSKKDGLKERNLAPDKWRVEHLLSQCIAGCFSFIAQDC